MRSKKEEAEQQRKRFLNSGDVYYFRYNYLVWKPSRCDLGHPKFQNFPGGASPQTPLKRACFTLTFRTVRSTVYVPLSVPEQQPYSGYATAFQQYLYWHLVQNVRRRVRGSQTQTLVVSPFEAYLKPFYSYSRTSDNGPYEKRTTSLQRTYSVLRIEITIVVILKQPPRSGRFLIPDSGQDPDSQRHFSIQNCL